MRALSYADAFQVLLLQLGNEGRDETLLGGCAEHAKEACIPFLVGKEFPDLYLEFPLKGEPFLDVTMLYGQLEPGTRIDAPAAAGTEAILDWYAQVRAEYGLVSFGFELDTSKPELPPAAVHFQPRTETHLVEPFCELAGEPERAKLYLDLAARMPEGWPLSFFGMFRGRPDSPLRVCGYLSGKEQNACAADPAHLADIFDAIGFTAYDDAMLAEVSAVMGHAPGKLDFQFDVFPDSHLSDVFAIDAQFEIKQPATVRENFEHGPASQLFDLLERLGVVDERRHMAADPAFARAIPAVRDDGTTGPFTFTILPQWMKVRWKAGAIQPAKLYYLARSGFLEKEDSESAGTDTG